MFADEHIFVSENNCLWFAVITWFLEIFIVSCCLLMNIFVFFLKSNYIYGDLTVLNILWFYYLICILIVFCTYSVVTVCVKNSNCENFVLELVWWIQLCFWKLINSRNLIVLNKLYSRKICVFLNLMMNKNSEFIIVWIQSKLK